MKQYLIRTDFNDKKTHILSLESNIERIGLLYTDYLLSNENRDINSEDITDPKTKKTLAKVRLFQDNNIISVFIKRKQLSALTNDESYIENGKKIPYRRLTRNILLTKPEYKDLEEYGLTHAFFFPKDSESRLSQVFCFEKDHDISGLVYSKGNDLSDAFIGVSLVLSQRIKNQDYIFEFIKK